MVTLTERRRSISYWEGVCGSEDQSRHSPLLLQHVDAHHASKVKKEVRIQPKDYELKLFAYLLPQPLTRDVPICPQCKSRQYYVHRQSQRKRQTTVCYFG